MKEVDQYLEIRRCLYAKLYHGHLMVKANSVSEKGSKGTFTFAQRPFDAVSGNNKIARLSLRISTAPPVKL